MWDLYKFQPSFVLGFHGCDKSVAERVLAGAGKPHLRRSTNQYDWLGNGIYFWESSPKRAMEWAEFVRDNPSVSSGKVVTPAVVGAIIDLGYCGTLHDRAQQPDRRSFNCVSLGSPEHPSLGLAGSTIASWL